jgi:hypothetical protein
MKRDKTTSSAASRTMTTGAILGLFLILQASIGPEVAVGRPKRLASGLMTVGNTGDWPNIVDVWVPAVEWRVLQPQRDRYRFGSIDNLIARAKASGDTIRLRIMAGRFAPDWAKRRFGTVGVYDEVDGINATVPRWWVPGYMDAYARLQAKLAARYDGNATIRSVTVSGAMTVYAEPFIRGTQSASTRTNLIAAGYSPSKDKRSIHAMLGAQRPWKRTRQILAFNAWQFVRRDGTFGIQTSFPNQIMDRFRSIFGSRAILQNNSIRASWILDEMPRVMAPIYRHMKALGGPRSYQTARTFRVGDLATVLEWCLRQGAHGVEIHQGASDQISSVQAKRFDTRLEANA